MTQNTLESALKMQEGRKFKNFLAQWKATPLPLDPHPLETLSHIFILIKKHYVFIIKQMPKNTFKRVFFQNIFPLRGQQGGGLATPHPLNPHPLPAHCNLESCHKIKNCHKNSYPPLKKNPM